MASSLKSVLANANPSHFRDIAGAGAGDERKERSLPLTEKMSPEEMPSR
jgi:hypothetical protein